MNERKGAEAEGTAKAAQGAKGPEELRQQIAETRGQLGDTVEELAAKADVRARARARRAELKGKASEAGHTVQGKAAQAGHVAQEKAAQVRHVAQEKAAHAGHAVQGKATHAGHVVQENVPQPVRTAASTVIQAGLRHPRPVLIAGAGAVVAAGILRRRHHTQQPSHRGFRGLSGFSGLR
ncbi:DUF3618 domain-containing protein [Streptomyces sp. HC44]|uniref:DUF3618 domain-containing protein n=1 Tax=Streptomyces scabichelini TaxID=2711217 RepID=A0A6G4V092_9ACTN|nr:DUF3618 domain-containing protein [Streptomyces scabichelini]NGO07419.1 DUF3618 domain-containing protein [Streptomyces scabichelini]